MMDLNDFGAYRRFSQDCVHNNTFRNFEIVLVSDLC
jgi:hypothetical protein